MVRSPRWARKFFNDTVLTYEGDDCLTWPYATIKGYGALRVDGKLEYVCRLVCEGQPTPEKPNVLHTCGRGAQGCVNKRHLRYGSQQENCDDRETHGTVNRGQRNGRNKLTESDVREIRALASSGTLTRRAIGDIFGVTRECINDIVWGVNWAWLKEDK